MVKKEIEARTIMYVQQIAHLHITIDQINARLKDLADNYKDVRYAYIVHDKDMVEDTNKAVEPHIHVMVQVGKSNNWALSKWADDLFSDTAEHVQKWKGQYNTGVSYLCHLTDSAVAAGKFQYPMEDVVSNEDVPKLLKKIKKAVNNTSKGTVNNALLRLDAGIESFDSLANSLMGKDKVDFLRKAKTILEYQQSQVEDISEPLEVIYIYGESGSGKTRLAWELAGDEPTYITGSSKHPWDGYKGESVVIWDDARFKGNDPSEILRLLDPHAKTRIAPARFNDKNLNNVKTIYITTIDNPYRLWTSAFQNEPVAQFKRRLADVYHVKKTTYELENSRKNKKLPWLETTAKSNKIKSDDKQTD